MFGEPVAIQVLQTKMHEAYEKVLQASSDYNYAKQRYEQACKSMWESALKEKK